jgi:hypothetical protein
MHGNTKSLDFLDNTLTPLHIQNARFAGSYEWHGTVTLRILNAQRCKRPLIEPLLETIDKDNYKDKKSFLKLF